MADMGHQLQLVGVTLLEDAMTEDSVRVREEQRERERERGIEREGGRESAGGFQHHEQGIIDTFEPLLYSVTPQYIYRVRAKYRFQRRWKGGLFKKCIIVIFFIILVLYIFEEKKMFSIFYK